MFEPQGSGSGGSKSTMLSTDSSIFVPKSLKHAMFMKNPITFIKGKNEEETLVVIQISEEVKRKVQVDQNLSIAAFIDEIFSKSFLENAARLFYTEDLFKNMILAVGELGSSDIISICFKVSNIKPQEIKFQQLQSDQLPHFIAISQPEFRLNLESTYFEYLCTRSTVLFADTFNIKNLFTLLDQPNTRKPCIKDFVMKNSAKMLMHLPLSFSELYNDLTKNHKRGLDLIEAAKLYSDKRKFIEIFHEIMSDQLFQDFNFAQLSDNKKSGSIVPCIDDGLWDAIAKNILRSRQKVLCVFQNSKKVEKTKLVFDKIKALFENDKEILESQITLMIEIDELNDQLKKGFLKLTEFSIVLFDEVHYMGSRDHLYNEIMTIYYFNSQNQYQLPYIIGLYELSQVLKVQENQILSDNSVERLQQFANTLNSRVIRLDEMRTLKLLLKCRKIRHIPHQTLESIYFYHSSTSLSIKPIQNIWKLKKFSPHLILVTSIGKLVIPKDAQSYLLVFLSTVQKISKIKLETSYKLSTLPWRHFYVSKFIFFDDILIRIFGSQDFLKHEMGSSKAKIFPTAEESEDYLALEALKYLHSKMYLDDQMKPIEKKIWHIIMEKKRSENFNNEEIEMERIDKMMSNLIRNKRMTEQEVENFMINNPNSYNHSTEIYNVKMLEFFLSKIFNPLLHAVSDYNLHSKFMLNYKSFGKETNTNDDQTKQKTQEMIQIYSNLKVQTQSSNHYSLDWADIEYSDISNPPFQQKLSKIKEIKKYVKKIFGSSNMLDFKIKKFSDSPQFMNLAKGLTGSMLKYLEIPLAYYKHFQKRQICNQKFIMIMLIIALTDALPLSPKFKTVQEEMQRLALAGKFLIEKAVTMHILLKYRGDLNSEELNNIRNNIINPNNLQQKCQQYGLSNILLKPKFMENMEEENIKNSIQSPRSLLNVFSSIVGVLGIFLGFNTAYIFLIEIGILDNFFSPLVLQQDNNQNQFLNHSDILKKISLIWNDTIKCITDQIYLPEDNLSNIYPQRISLKFFDNQCNNFLKCIHEKATMIGSINYPKPKQIIEGTTTLQYGSVTLKNSIQDATITKSFQQFQKPQKIEINPQPKKSKSKSHQTGENASLLEEFKSKLQEGQQTLSEGNSLDAESFESQAHSSVNSDQLNSIAQCLEGFSQTQNHQVLDNKYIQKNKQGTLTAVYELEMYKLVSNSKRSTLEIQNFNHPKLIAYVQNDMFSDNCSTASLLNTIGKSSLFYQMSKQLYIETLSLTQYYNVNKLERLINLFTSYLWLGYLFYQKVALHGNEIIPKIVKHDQSKKNQSIGSIDKEILNEKFSNQKLDNQREIFSLFNMRELQNNENLTKLKTLIKDNNFATYFESWIGAIILDSADLNYSQLVVQRLMSPDYTCFEKEMNKVKAILNEKKYTKDLNISNKVFTQSNYNYVTGYIGKQQLFSIKFKKENLDQEERYYQEMGFFLKNLNFNYEKYCKEKSLSNMGRREWLSYLKEKIDNYQQERKFYLNQALQNKKVMIYKACKILYDSIQEKEQNHNPNRSLLTVQEQQLKIINAFNLVDEECQGDLLLHLENERIRYEEIHNFYEQCSIKQIDGVSFKNKTVEAFVKRMPTNVVQNLFYQMKKKGKKLTESQQAHQTQKSKIRQKNQEVF